MGLGDELMAAGHAQRVYDADPSKRVAICDVHDRPRWHELWNGNPIIASPESVHRGESVHRIKNDRQCRPYIRYPFTARTGLTCTAWRARDHLGRLYLTEAERETGRTLACSGPYVVIEPSRKPGGSANKSWGHTRYAAVVRSCALRDIRFVQMMYDGATPLTGATTLTVRSFREACGVVAHAAAYLGPEGGLHHAAAVLGVPGVVLFGGFISPQTTGYPCHVNLYDSGPASPCGRWLLCPHCTEAFNRITVEQVTQALLSVLVSREQAYA